MGAFLNPMFTNNTCWKTLVQYAIPACRGFGFAHRLEVPLMCVKMFMS